MGEGGYIQTGTGEGTEREWGKDRMNGEEDTAQLCMV